MQVQQHHIVSDIATTIPAAYPASDIRRIILTVGQFSARNPAFSQAALRNLIFKADCRHSSKGEIPGNGLIEASAIIRIGRKVLIDEARFFAWIDRQSESGSKTQTHTAAKV